MCERNIIARVIVGISKKESPINKLSSLLVNKNVSAIKYAYNVSKQISLDTANCSIVDGCILEFKNDTFDYDDVVYVQAIFNTNSDSPAQRMTNYDDVVVSSGYDISNFEILPVADNFVF
jgi:hypothetical protein